MTITGPAAPSGGGSSVGVEWRTLNGALLLFDVGSLEVAIPTTFGPADAMRVTVAALDGPLTGTVWDDILVFPKVLVSQLAPRAHGKVVGRLAQGTAKAGQSPPWVLLDPSPQDLATAYAYDQQRNSPTGPAAAGTVTPMRDDAPF